MKKSLFILAAAALVLVGCEKDQKVAENKAPQREIAFATFAQKAHYSPGIKKAPIDGVAFPTDLDMMVTAYNVTASASFFDATPFKYQYAGGADSA